MIKQTLLAAALIFIIGCSNKAEPPAVENTTQIDPVPEETVAETAASPTVNEPPTTVIENADERSASERAGLGEFDASGMIPCAESKGQPMGQCPFKVARGSNGSAAVIVTHSDGRTRALFFEGGKATSADLSQADGNLAFSSSKQADLFMIQAGDERYEVPEAVIFGG